MDKRRGPGRRRAPSDIFPLIRHEPIKVETMKVKLKDDYTVCRDGIHPESFQAGAEVDMPVHIASVLIEDGRAVIPAATEHKHIPGAPENKADESPGPGRRKRRA